MTRRWRKVGECVLRGPYPEQYSSRPSRHVACTDDRSPDRIDRARRSATGRTPQRCRLRVGPVGRRALRASERPAQPVGADAHRLRHRRDDHDLERRRPRLRGHHQPERPRVGRRRRPRPLLGQGHGGRDGHHRGAHQPCRGHVRLAGRGHVGHAAAERPSRTAPAAVAPARYRRPHRQLERVAGAPRRRPAAAHRLAQRRRRTRRATLPLRLPEPRRHGERGHQHPDPHVRRARLLRPGWRRGARPLRLRRRRQPDRRAGARTAVAHPTAPPG